MSRDADDIGHRQRYSFWWRPPCVILALLLLALPFVPFACPVGFTAGSWALLVHAFSPPGRSRPGGPAWGISSMTFGGPHPRIRSEAGQEFLFAGPVTVRCLRIAGWSYYVAWGKGRRTK